MAPRRPNPGRQSTRPAGDGPVPDGEPEPVVRRPPFADSPQVGARGQRTQQRIVDAALRVFGEVGYHQCGVARITEAAGCSRAAFYQYFSSKEDVFRHLAGQVARQMAASTEALGPLTPDAEGWATLRAWAARHADIYERYEPVFKAFPLAAERDEEVAATLARAGERNVAIIRSKLATAPLPPRQLDPVIKLLMECLTFTQEAARYLRSAAPDAFPRQRVDDAFTDVAHRTLFGLLPEVNVHPPARQRPPPVKFGPVIRDVLQREETPELTAAGQRTLEALMEAGREVLVTRGYHNTRVDDVVAAAGVSHGTFYRYFQSKDDLAFVLAARAIRTAATALFADVPDTAAHGGSPGRAALRRWLRRYNAAHATEAAITRVWADAALGDRMLGPDSAALFDWGRRWMANFLQPRGFGDVDTEAVVMMALFTVLALLSVFGEHERSTAVIDAVAYVIDRGLLGTGSHTS